MSKLTKIVLFIASLFSIPAMAQTVAFNGYCTQGSVPAVLSGLNSSNLLQGLIPQCTVTVYQTGTTTKATLFSNASNTPLTNPFTASTKAQWLFYAAGGIGYDIVMSGGKAPLVYTTPVSITDVMGGGGSGTVIEVNGAPISPASPANYVDSDTVTWDFSSGALHAHSSSSLSISAVSPVAVNDGTGPISSGVATVSCPGCGLQPQYIPAAAGQYALVYAHTCVTTGDCGPSFGDVGQQGFSNGSIDWSDYTLPSYINPANVTAVYAFAVSSSSLFGTSLLDFDTSTGLSHGAACSAGQPSPRALTPYGGGYYVVGQTTCPMNIPPDFSLATMHASVCCNGQGALHVYQIGLEVHYTGTPPAALPTSILVQAPLVYSTQSNALGVSNGWPNLTYATVVANLPRPVSPGSLSWVNDGSTSTDCSVGGGSNLNLCYWNGSVYANVSNSGSGTAISTNGTPNTTQGILNFVDPGSFNGLNIAFSNPSGGIETFGITGTLNNSGLTNSTMTINGSTCTLGSPCTVSGFGGNPGGTSGQIQWNNAGAFAGTTVNGDGTLNAASGQLVVTKTNGTLLGTFATQNFATPPAIGGSTPNIASFSSLTVSGLSGCVQATAGVFSATGGSCGGTPQWNQIIAPISNQTLAMAAFTTTFNQVSTGSGDLWKWNDSGSGTGILGHFVSTNGIPWQADNGTAGFRISATTGALSGIGFSTAATIGFTQGSAPGAAPANTIQLYAPAAITAYNLVLPNAAPTSGNTYMSCTAASPSVCSFTSSSSVAAFGSLTGGTNTTAAMLVGTGASLGPTGTGTVSANQVNGAAVPASKSFVGTNGSNQIVDASTTFGTSSIKGIVQCDGTTITCTSGVITSIGGSPTGTAGGDLTGTYPNPGVGKVNGAVIPTTKAFVGTNSSNQIVDASTTFGTNAAKGILQCDGTTINCSSGVIATIGRAWACQPGLGDGKTSIASGTYLQTTCKNTTGSTITLSGIQCFTDNSGSSTMNVTNGAGTGLLTGAVTCTTGFAAGTQSGTTTIANNDFLKFTFVADGTSKQSTFVIIGSY